MEKFWRILQVNFGKRKFSLFVVIAVCFACSSFADQFLASIENDVFAPSSFGHSDDDYSNGARFEYLMSNNEFGFAFGQSMYTPTDLTIAEDQPGERQYAGWLYLEGNYRRVPTEFGAIQVGFIGKNSLAEQTQKTIHKWIGSKDPKGWDNQIEGHGIEIQSYYKKMWHLLKYSDWYYLCPALTLSAGSVNVMGTPGIFNYLCFNYVPSYENGLPVTETRGIDNNFSRLSAWIPSVYLFAGAECDMVAYNYFLDAKESSVDKEIFVGEFSAGLGLQIKNFVSRFAYVFRTREYEEQKHPANFGVISVGFNF